MEIFLSITAFLVVAGLMTWWMINKRNDVWEGELVKKNWTPGDSESSPSYYLVFKTKEGKTKRFNTPDENFYNSWTIGEKAIKNKGAFFPEKDNR